MFVRPPPQGNFFFLPSQFPYLHPSSERAKEISLPPTQLKTLGAWINFLLPILDTYKDRLTIEVVSDNLHCNWGDFVLVMEKRAKCLLDVRNFHSYLLLLRSEFRPIVLQSWEYRSCFICVLSVREHKQRLSFPNIFFTRSSSGRRTDPIFGLFWAFMSRWISTCHFLESRSFSWWRRRHLQLHYFISFLSSSSPLQKRLVWL